MVTFSSDGRFLAYNERDGGADEVTLRMRDPESGSHLPDVLPRGLYGAVFFDQEEEGSAPVRTGGHAARPGRGARLTSG